jgi:hypothetical protein
MKSRAIPRFWRLFHGLPPEAQRLAVKTFGASSGTITIMS